MHCTREEFGKVTYWLQTLRSWRRRTHRKSTRKDSMRKRWYFPKENLFFQSQMDESKPFEEIRTWEHPPWYGIDQFNEKVILTFLENQKGLFTTSRLISGCRWSDKRLLVHVGKLHIPPSRWTQSQALLAKRRIIPYSTEVHWRIQNYTRIWMLSRRSALMIIGTLMALESCLILGQNSHNILYWKKKFPTDICGPEGDWRENSLHPGQISYGQNSGSQWESTPSWRRSRSGLMKNSILKTHENCEGSISLTRRIRNFKKPLRMFVRSWKHQLLLLRIVKLWWRIGWLVVNPTK